MTDFKYTDEQILLIQEAKKRLPANFLQLLRLFIFKRHKKNYNITYLSRVLSVNPPNDNPLIFECFVDFCIEHADKQKENTNRLKSAVNEHAK